MTEPDARWHAKAIAVFFGSICVLLAVPHILQDVKFPLAPLNAIIDWLILIVIGGLVFGIVNLLRVSRKMARKATSAPIFLKITWAPGGAIILGFFTLVFCNMMKSGGRIEVKELLDQLSVDPCVAINGVLIDNPDRIMAELRQVAPRLAHRSHTTLRIKVEIAGDGEKLLLWVERDSANPREYWVFYPKYDYTSRHEVGRIITEVFDDY